MHRREWLTPTAAIGDGRHETVQVADDIMEMLVRMAQASKLTFELRIGSLAPANIGAVYRRWAKAHRALTASGSIRHRVMLDQLEPRFRGIAQAYAGLGPVACELSAANIVGSVARETPKPVHPAKHLAVLVSMFGSVQELALELVRGGEICEEDQDIRCPEKRTEVSLGWDARAALSDFLEAVKSGASVRAASKAAGVSTSTGVRWAKQHGKEFTARPKTITEQLAQSISLALERGGDRTDVATQHGVSLMSVNRLLSTDHNLRDRWQATRHALAQCRHRQVISEFVSAHPDYSAKQIRQGATASWMWLYRHDKSWLADVMPSLWHHGGRPNGSRIA